MTWSLEFPDSNYPGNSGKGEIHVFEEGFTGELGLS